MNTCMGMGSGSSVLTGQAKACTCLALLALAWWVPCFLPPCLPAKPLMLSPCQFLELGALLVSSSIQSWAHSWQGPRPHTLWFFSFSSRRESVCIAMMWLPLWPLKEVGVRNSVTKTPCALPQVKYDWKSQWHLVTPDRSHMLPSWSSLERFLRDQKRYLPAMWQCNWKCTVSLHSSFRGASTREKSTVHYFVMGSPQGL